MVARLTQRQIGSMRRRLHSINSPEGSRFTDHIDRGSLGGHMSVTPDNYHVALDLLNRVTARDERWKKGEHTLHNAPRELRIFVNYALRSILKDHPYPRPEQVGKMTDEFIAKAFDQKGKLRPTLQDRFGTRLEKMPNHKSPKILLGDIEQRLRMYEDAERLWKYRQTRPA